MKTIFGSARYLVLIAVLGLLIAALAVFVFAGVATVSIVVDSFRESAFDSEGARALRVDVIEMIDLFLLGPVLLITALGLYELFIDPGVREVIPEWMSVQDLEDLKFNLLAVVAVMVSILFLGAVASEQPEGTGTLEYGLAIAAVLLAMSATVWVFGRASQRIEVEQEEAALQEESGTSPLTHGSGKPSTEREA